MYIKAVDNYPHALEFIYERYETQKMFDKSVNIDSFIIKCVSECCKTHNMCNKAVNRCFFCI